MIKFQFDNFSSKGDNNSGCNFPVFCRQTSPRCSSHNNPTMCWSQSIWYRPLWVFYLKTKSVVQGLSLRWSLSPILSASFPIFNLLILRLRLRNSRRGFTIIGSGRRLIILSTRSMRTVLTLKLIMHNKTGIFGPVMWPKCSTKNQPKTLNKKKSSPFTSPNQGTTKPWCSSHDLNAATYLSFQKFPTLNTTCCFKWHQYKRVLSMVFLQSLKYHQESQGQV